MKDFLASDLSSELIESGTFLQFRKVEDYEANRVLHSYSQVSARPRKEGDQVFRVENAGFRLMFDILASPDA